jgi:hypothetical protein
MPDATLFKFMAMFVFMIAFIGFSVFGITFPEKMTRMNARISGKQISKFRTRRLNIIFLVIAILLSLHIVYKLQTGTFKWKRDSEYYSWSDILEKIKPRHQV